MGSAIYGSRQPSLRGALATKQSRLPLWPRRTASPAAIKDRVLDFTDLLASAPVAELFDKLRAAESIGRPLGDDRFLSRIERRTGRDLKPGGRGPKPLGPQGRRWARSRERALN
jgi:hypothetical protein